MTRLSSPIHIRTPERDELPGIIRQLDQEFVYTKRRSMSLTRRFPHALSADKIDRIRVAVADGVLCGALVTRTFEWAVGREIWLGAMIGMVWVDSQYRGMGIGSDLLRSTTQFLRDTGVAFGVLWTGSSAFYERAGWFLSDRSLLGDAAPHPILSRIAEVSCRPLGPEDVAPLECLRSSTLKSRVVRKTVDYCAVPIPAEKVLCFSADGKGFALVGERDGTGFLYEMIGPSYTWEVLWFAVTASFEKLLINGHSDDPFSRWLAENKLVAWRPQQKAMWLQVSDCLERSLISTWHIPYYDWI